MDKSAIAVVDLALKVTGLNQTQLAKKLKVSPGQISKWKNGEYMSHDMETKMKELAGIGEYDAQVVAWAGSLDAAKKWDALFMYMANMSNEGGETGYDTYPLTDEAQDLPGILIFNTISTLDDMGVKPPKNFPTELEAVREGDNDWDYNVLLENPHAALVARIYSALVDIWGFYRAYIEDLLNDEDVQEEPDDSMRFESELWDLAATKIEIEKSDRAEFAKFAPKFPEFKRTTFKSVKKWLSQIKLRAMKAGVPLEAEIMDLLTDDPETLSREAEAKSFGFKANRLHPDIYMNELLVGMRIIHQVLPAIMKKLGIDEDFKLDESELRQGDGRRFIFDELSVTEADDDTEPAEPKFDTIE
jgi:transcriptional regulator with XRE-family HTH domain